MRFRVHLCVCCELSLELSCPFAAAYNFLVPFRWLTLDLVLETSGRARGLLRSPWQKTWVELEAGMSEGWRRDLQLTS